MADSHTAATLKAALAEIAASIGPDARATVTVVDRSKSRPVYVVVYAAQRSGPYLCYGEDLDDALAAARAYAATVVAAATAAEREYASWVPAALMAAE